MSDLFKNDLQIVVLKFLVFIVLILGVLGVLLSQKQMATVLSPSCTL